MSLTEKQKDYTFLKICSYLIIATISLILLKIYFEKETTFTSLYIMAFGSIMYIVKNFKNIK